MNSALDQLFKFWVESEIPAFYDLVELFFLTLGGVYFFSSLWMLGKVRAINGTYNAMAFQMTDVSLTHVMAKFSAGVFLMSFGAGQALIANSLYATNDLTPYSAEMFRSISCVNGSVQGCLHYDLGLFRDPSWQNQLVNQNFFNLATALLQIVGVLAYGRGWLNVGRLGAPPTSGKQPPTLGGCLTQIGLGAMAMHPYELIALFN